jgi:NAD(P)H dehydrogenase (quinone)
MRTIGVFGAAGRVGRATVRDLAGSGVAVRAVIHASSPDTTIDGASSVIRADLRVSRSIEAAIEGCDAVQVVVPMPGRSPDPHAEMSVVIDALADALYATPEVAVVAISDYGAEMPSGTGITTIFHRLEARLAELMNPLIFVRSAEHMHNWQRQLAATLRTGMLASMHQPLTKKFPTIHAPDLGSITAALLLTPPAPDNSPRVVYAEGPDRYSTLDVAAAFTAITGTEITASPLPRQEWEPTLTAAGAPPKSAALVAELYDAHNAGRIEATPRAEIRHGTTQLEDALAAAITGATGHE